MRRSKDRWFGENICVREYSHTISIYGFYDAILGQSFYYTNLESARPNGCMD